MLNLVVSFTSYKITFDKKIFLPVLLIIGVILAGSFNISLLYKIHLWIYSSIAMIICTIVGTVVVAFYFVKICKFKKYVSTLAALPGAFVVISTAISDITNNKKERGQVVIPQATRVLFVVLFLPFIFVTQIGYQEIDSFGNIATYNLRYFLEIIFLIIVSLIGTKVLEKFRIPSAPILAAMIVAGFFYTLELTTAHRFGDSKKLKRHKKRIIEVEQEIIMRNNRLEDKENHNWKIFTDLIKILNHFGCLNNLELTEVGQSVGEIGRAHV